VLIPDLARTGIFAKETESPSLFFRAKGSPFVTWSDDFILSLLKNKDAACAKAARRILQHKRSIGVSGMS
jgi:hypothetical protein